MPDKEKVIKGLEMCIADDFCDGCPYEEHCFSDGEITAIRMMRDALSLLKEQEAVKPVLDEQTGRIWLCGKCGSYVGYEDNDPDDLNEFDKHCRNCGTPVLWEGR